MRRRNFIGMGASASAIAMLGPIGVARAQSNLAQARIVVGFPAGDPADVAARLFAQVLKNQYASMFIVDNRAGAGGRLGVQEMRNAALDGSVLLFTPASMLTIYPHVYKALPYDPFRDLLPVSRAITFTFALTVGPMVPDSVKTVRQFVAWCKENPAQATCGSPGAGTSPHFLLTALTRTSGASINHVPYRGGSLAVNDMIGGQVASVFTSPAAVLPHVKSGRARILAVTSPNRWPMVPGAPTMTEEGYPSVTATEWFGFFMRSGTPREMVERASEAIQRAAKAEEIVKGLQPYAMEVGGSSPAEFERQMRADFAMWGEVVKTSGYEPQD